MLLLTDYENNTNEYRGGSRIFGKGVLMYENVEVRVADFKYPMKMKYLASLKPNYFIFMGYLKTGGGEKGWIQDFWKGGSYV